MDLLGLDDTPHWYFCLEGSVTEDTELYMKHWSTCHTFAFPVRLSVELLYNAGKLIQLLWSYKSRVLLRTLIMQNTTPNESNYKGIEWNWCAEVYVKCVCVCVCVSSNKRRREVQIWTCDPRSSETWNHFSFATLYTSSAHKVLTCERVCVRGHRVISQFSLWSCFW